MATENLHKINQQIYSYWNESKILVLRTRLKKKRVGTFTRANGRRKKALKDNWRYNNGIRSHDIKRPSIGYKRDLTQRFRRAADGLLFRRISCVKDLTLPLKPHEVFMVASAVSAYKRTKILEQAKNLKVPLYIQKPKLNKE